MELITGCGVDEGVQEDMPMSGDSVSRGRPLEFKGGSYDGDTFDGVRSERGRGVGGREGLW